MAAAVELQNGLSPDMENGINLYAPDGNDIEMATVNSKVNK